MSVQRHRVAVIAVIVVGMSVGLLGTTLRGQGAPQAEVRAALDEYVRAFSARDANAIADRMLTTPWLLLDEAGALAYGTVGDVKNRYTTVLDQMAADRYDHSLVKSATVCVMSDNAAVVTAQFVRYRTDGSTLSEGSGTYIFAKSGERWKIAMQINHAQGRGVTCEAGSR